jgi:hypothetical protein
MYWNFDIRRKWDTFFSFMKSIEIFNDGSELIHMGSWAPPFVSKRDFVQVRKYKIYDDGKMIVGVFLPAIHDEKCPSIDGCMHFLCMFLILNEPLLDIRGIVRFAGFVLRDLGKDDQNGIPQTQFTLITDTDAGGMPVPIWIVTKLIAMGARIYKNYIQSAIKERFPQKEDN